MTSNTYYTPVIGDDIDTLIEKAYRCGYELRPNDRRSRWLDEQPKEIREDVLASYHVGQMEQYEQEDW